MRSRWQKLDKCRPRCKKHVTKPFCSIFRQCPLRPLPPNVDAHIFNARRTQQTRDITTWRQWPLAPRTNLLTRRQLPGPPSSPTEPTRHPTKMAELGGCSPNPPLLVGSMTPSSSTHPRRAHMVPSATGYAAASIKRGWPMENWPFSLHTIINFARNSLALDGCKSSKATLQPKKTTTQQSTMAWERVAPEHSGRVSLY